MLETQLSNFGKNQNLLRIEKLKSAVHSQLSPSEISNNRSVFLERLQSSVQNARIQIPREVHNSHSLNLRVISKVKINSELESVKIDKLQFQNEKASALRSSSLNFFSKNKSNSFHYSSETGLKNRNQAAASDPEVLKIQARLADQIRSQNNGYLKVNAKKLEGLGSNQLERQQQEKTMKSVVSTFQPENSFSFNINQ